jgi:hypothetical protein
LEPVVRILFLGGPWHDQVHEIPDGTDYWEVAVEVTVADNYPGGWGTIVDHFMYRRIDDAMVPSYASFDEVAELLRDRR